MNKIILALRIANLGATPLDKLRLLYWSARARAGMPLSPIRIGIKFPHSVQTICFNSIADIWVLKDVMLDKEYEVAIPENPSVVVDLGANIGISTAYLAARYPNATIHAVEPNPHLYEQSHENTAGRSNVRLHRFALAGQDGPVRLSIGASSAASSIMTKQGEESVEVEGLTFKTLLLHIGASQVDLLKFDIEGAEQYIFAGNAPLPVNAYVGEMHYDKMQLTREQVRVALAGYTVTERPAGRPDRALLYAHRKLL